MSSDTSIYGDDVANGETLQAIGNYRVAQEASDEHKVRWVETTFDYRIMNDGLKVAVGIMTFVSVIMLMVLVYCCVYFERAKEEDAELAKLNASKGIN